MLQAACLEVGDVQGLRCRGSDRRSRPALRDPRGRQRPPSHTLLKTPPIGDIGARQNAASVTLPRYRTMCLCDAFEPARNPMIYEAVRRSAGRGLSDARLEGG